MSETGSDV